MAGWRMSAFGLFCIAVAIYYGLHEIAEAIKSDKRINVTLPPIHVVDGSDAAQSLQEK